jgi:deaminated glutathione amidase
VALALRLAGTQPAHGTCLLDVETVTTLTAWPLVQMVVCATPAGHLGLSTCYDVRFPTFYQRLAHEGGAHMLLVPSAFTVPTGAAHWHALLRARAIEAQCFVVAAAQAGRHNARRESYGHSIVVGPWGDVVGELDGSEPGLLVVDLDFEELERIRKRMPVRQHWEKGEAVVRRPIRQAGKAGP